MEVSRLPTSYVMWVQAFAGSAKTFTARAIVAALRTLHRALDPSSHRPQNVLYVVYNRANKEEARKVLREDWDATGGALNFSAMTIHGLAASWLKDSPYKHRNASNLQAATVRAFLAQHWRVDRKQVTFAIVRAVMDGLSCFLASDDEEPGSKHFGQLWGERKDKALKAVGAIAIAEADGAAGGSGASGAQCPPSDYCMRRLVKATGALWDEIRSEDSNLPLPFNGYLKLYAMTKPQLKDLYRDLPYDIIIIDEAQDLNSVSRQLLIDTQTSATVLLGDPYQQLYSFNYACGLMGPNGRKMIPAVRHGPKMPLSAAFRYDRELAAPVNLLLRVLGEKGSVVGRRQAQPQGAVYVSMPYGKSLHNVCMEDLGLPAESGSAAGLPLRFVQCPMRGTVVNPDWPPELHRVPGCSAVLVPDGVLPGVRPRVFFVARMNMTLVGEALRLVAAGHTVCATFAAKGGAAPAAPGSSRGQPLASMMLRRVVDLVHFLGGKRGFPERHELHDLADEAELVALIESGADPELGLAYGLVKELQEGDPAADVIAKMHNLESKLVHDRSQADYYLCTVHKAKGDEAHIVQLADDFKVPMAPVDKRGRMQLERALNATSRSNDTQQADEAFAVYVAATRAKSLLVLNRDVSALVLQLDTCPVSLLPPEGLTPPEPGQGVAWDDEEAWVALAELAEQRYSPRPCPCCGKLLKFDPQRVHRWRVDCRGRPLCKGCEAASPFDSIITAAVSACAEPAAQPMCTNPFLSGHSSSLQPAMMPLQQQQLMHGWLPANGWQHGGHAHTEPLLRSHLQAQPPGALPHVQPPALPGHFVGPL